MKKGLRHLAGLKIAARRKFESPNCCPDEEGIKTIFPSFLFSAGPFPASPNCCPDEEGIKTPRETLM